jgi:hypothetical protein
MFRQSVSQTAFTSEGANSFFGDRVLGDQFGSDSTLVATLRALAYPRFQSENDKIHVRISSTICNSATLGQTPAQDELKRILDTYKLGVSQDQFVIHGFRSSAKEHTAAYMRLVESEFEKCFKGYERVDKVTAFYKKSFDVICYINREKRNSIFFVDGLDVRKLHYLQCSILVAIPWYYDPTKGLTDDEKALVRSFYEQSHEKYQECLSKLAEKYDFRSAQIRSVLGGIESRFIKRERDDLSTAIDNIDREINRLSEKIGLKFKEREESSIRLLGIEEMINRGETPESELAEYFICNKHLVLDYVDGERIYFKTIADLTQFDPEMAESQIKNKRSQIYMRDGCSRSVSYDDLHLLMSAIFLDCKLTIRFCGAYYVDLGNRNCNGLQGQNYDDPAFINCMPNPHIDGYSCMGNNTRYVAEMIAKHNYMGAIDQCLGSCSNLNFGDSTVMNRFMSRVTDAIKNGGKKCVRLPDGSYTDFKGALEYLKTGVVADA